MSLPLPALDATQVGDRLSPLNTLNLELPTSVEGIYVLNTIAGNNHSHH